MPAKTSSTLSRKHGGFTLFELLVVIVIISITFALFMSVNFSSGNPAERIRKEASRLQSLLSFAHEQSVIRGEEYGIYFQPASYNFMLYITEDDNWVPVDGDPVLTEKQLTDHMELELTVEDTDIVIDEPETTALSEDEIKIKPQVFLLSSGETTPDFVIRFLIPDVDTTFEVHGTTDGKYELVQAQ
ncbi:MAG: type II secretion system minor pseudopilin GspH [Gammaproteobacteria bacterium]|nr:type II secretion system minor pseudopilin GspH [Gammaproteobacteria bacterium]